MQINRRLWGSAPVGRSGVAVRGAAMDIAPAPSGKSDPLAKAHAPEIKSVASSSTTVSGTPERSVTDAEIWTFVRQSAKLGSSDSELRTFLASAGYTGALLEAVASKVSQARSGVLQKPEWVKEEEDAQVLLDKAKLTDSRMAVLLAEAEDTKAQIAKLKEAEEAEVEATSSFDWVPGALSKGRQAAQDAVEKLRQAAAEAEAGAAVLKEAAALERSGAKELLESARRKRVTAELKERSAALTDVKTLIAAAEAALAAGDKSKAVALVESPPPAIAALGLRGEAAVGATSLPARLLALSAAVRPAAAAAAAAAGKSTDGGDSSPTVTPPPAAVTPPFVDFFFSSVDR